MNTLIDPAALEPGFLSWYALAFFSLVGPLLARSAHRRASAGGQAHLRRGRMRVYAGALLWLWVLVVLAWAAAREAGLPLLAPWRPGPGDVLVGVASFALGLLTLLPGVAGGDGLGRRRLRAILPRNRRELGAFYVLCVCAGVGEEIVYRGVLFHLWAALAGSWWIAAGLSALVFGAVHLYQGPRGAVVAGVYGFRDHVVVGLTGTLWVAIVVHVLHDAVLGTVIGARVRREEGSDDRPPDAVADLRAEMRRLGVSVDEDVLEQVRREVGDTGR